ncbi:hypothetical protein GCM10029976_004030 [Kribbella albertanoniae]
MMTINWHGTVKAGSHSGARAQRGVRTNYRGWDQEEKIASIAVPLRSEQRVIGRLNLVYMASAMTIEQAAEKHFPALQRVAKQIKKGLNCRLFWWPDGEAACIYVDTIEWRKTFRGMA